MGETIEAFDKRTVDECAGIVENCGNMCTGCLEAIRALPTTPSPEERWRPPEGYRLVPVEPTDKMVEAAGSAFFDATYAHVAGDLASVNTPFRRFYRAMLEAAPTPPVTFSDRG